jgi:hypothetical protein
VNEKLPIQGGHKLLPWIALVAVLILIGVAVVAYVNPESIPGTAAPGTAPESDGDVRLIRGSSCNSLDKARLAFEEESNREFVTSVRQAERAAMHALDTDFVWFGRPEEMALRIGAEKLNGTMNADAQERIRARLELAETACRNLQ